MGFPRDKHDQCWFRWASHPACLFVAKVLILICSLHAKLAAQGAFHLLCCALIWQTKQDTVEIRPMGGRFPSKPTGSMGLVYLPTFGWFFFMIHVGRYTIHASYGKWNCPCFHFRGQMLSSNKLQNERKTYFINSSPEYKLSWESRDRGFVGIKKIQNSPCAQGLQRKVEIFSSPWLLWHKHLKQHEIRTWTTSPGHG